jgi:hypothetical protein
MEKIPVYTKVYSVWVLERSFKEDLLLKKGQQIKWDKGMLGVMPVFESLESAMEAYPDRVIEGIIIT